MKKEKKTNEKARQALIEFENESLVSLCDTA